MEDLVTTATLSEVIWYWRLSVSWWALAHLRNLFGEPLATLTKWSSLKKWFWQSRGTPQVLGTYQSALTVDNHLEATIWINEILSRWPAKIKPWPWQDIHFIQLCCKYKTKQDKKEGKRTQRNQISSLRSSLSQVCLYWIPPRECRSETGFLCVTMATRWAKHLWMRIKRSLRQEAH